MTDIGHTCETEPRCLCSDPDGDGLECCCRYGSSLICFDCRASISTYDYDSGKRVDEP